MLAFIAYIAPPFPSTTSTELPSKTQFPLIVISELVYITPPLLSGVKPLNIVLKLPLQLTINDPTGLSTLNK